MTYIPYDQRNDVSITDLIGLTLASIEGKKGDDAITFKTVCGRTFVMYHDQDCVTVEDIVGDLQDLIGKPILKAEEVTHAGENPEGVTDPEYQDSFTWTFYKLATRKGYVDIRWYGESNGYYSERVSLVEHKKEAA